MTLHILSVDLQNDFASVGGALYQPRSCVPFITTTLIPWLQTQDVRIAEIVSDYRVAGSGTDTATCVPGQWGAQSIIPQEVKHASQWIKAEPSPVWIRAGGGDATQTPGVPYPDPHAFSAWLASTIGPPHADQQLVLIGLMLEICVLSTVQELYYRGYHAAVLFEGTDTYTGSVAHKQMLFDTLFPFWGRGTTWQQLSAQPEATHAKSAR